MFKKLTIIFMIIMIAFSQSVINIQTGATGSYSNVAQKQLNQLLQTDEFNNVLNLAKTYWQQTYNEALGRITDVQKQIVAGYNYKITFKPQISTSYQQAVVVVFVQPWTSTMEVIDAWTEPKAKGNLTKNR